MVSQSQFYRWFFVGIAVCGGAFFMMITIMTWPSMFVSEGRELTGIDLDLGQVPRFDDGQMREGAAAWIYRLPDDAADRLDADRQALRRYPMWCGLACDGYKRVRWQSIDELKGGPDHALVLSVFRSEGPPPDIADVNSLDDARELATWLASQDDVLISGWYTEKFGAVTNYFVYVLDLKRRVMVKLSSLS